MCAPVCAHLQQEEWLIFMIINIYQFPLFSCTRCWTWISVKKAQCSLSVFSFSVCREHWVWLYKLLQFLRVMVSYEIHFLMPAAWSWTKYIPDPWIHFKKKNELHTGWSHFKQVNFPLTGSSNHVGTYRPTHCPLHPQQGLSHHLGEKISSWIFRLHIL